jgi:hypothetical protein
MTSNHDELERLARAATPGPWVARRMHTGGFDIFDPRNRDVVTVYGGGVETESREANARLIAAAPEMFEALANLYHRTIVGTDEQRHAALDEAWRVLVKARTAVEGPSVGTSNASEPKNTPANGDSQ